MKFVLIILSAMFLTGCYVESGKQRPYNLIPAGTGRECCCEKFEGKDYEMFRWMCSRPPYERGECLPNSRTKCGKRKHHRRHHSTRGPDDDDRDFIKQNYQRSRKYEILNY